jgi:carboxymethylenebutenolidase
MIRRALAIALTLACGAALARAAESDAAYADSMAREHAGDLAVAGAAAGDAAQAGVVAEDVAYWPGEDVRGYLARPAEGTPRAGLIVIQEWWGLNDHIRTMARRFAQEGYAALAVDLYDGSVATDSDGAMQLMRSAMANSDRLRLNLAAADDYLTGTVGVTSVGSIGWCFGGGWSLETAIMLGDKLDAAVMYYGRVDVGAELASVSAPVLGHFGSEDQSIPVDGVRAFEHRMRELGKSITVYVYDGAGHAFANPTGTRYDAEAAELAWGRTVAFLNEHLGG